MPPPKAKLHKNTGRLKNINSSHSSPSSSTRSNPSTVNTSNQPNIVQSDRNRANELPANGPSSTNSPATEQFELELYWCIQTLENSLRSGKLNAKQAQDAEKTLKSLKSNSQPMVKKRQLMQTTFGDYRKKMIDEEKRLRVGNTSIQFIASTAKEQSISANKGHFVKKSFATSLGNNSNFQFNFPIDAMEKLSIEQSDGEQSKPDDKAVKSSNQNGNEHQSAIKIDTTPQTHSNPFVNSKLNTSDNNSFKFNFAVECD